MIEVIDVDENHNIDKFNAAAKRAHDNPETHGLLVKIYADWCGHCQNMKAEWARLTRELKKNYRCKKSGCVLTIANIRLANVEPNDPVLNFALTKQSQHKRSTLKNITKKAIIKFKDFHRNTLNQYHKQMRRDGYKPLDTRIPTPRSKRIPAYLR